MPQTRFVLKKALALKKKVLVVIKMCIRDSGYTVGRMLRSLVEDTNPAEKSDLDVTLVYDGPVEPEDVYKRQGRLSQGSVCP